MLLSRSAVLAPQRSYVCPTAVGFNAIKSACSPASVLRTGGPRSVATFALKPLSTQLPSKVVLDGEEFPVPKEVAPLYVPYKLGDIGELEHRVVYAPLTRCRSPGNIPQPVAAEYYSQRASKGGYLITEATSVAPEGQGYIQVPGIHSKEQTEAWKPIVKAVHDKGSKFALQLWHGGRCGHSSLEPGNQPPPGPSPIAIGKEFTFWNGKEALELETPRELSVEDIKQLVDRFRQGARNAIDAGFDGVEIHAANGYLIDQFLCDSSNKRIDEYGGSIEKRARFALEIVDAVSKEIGASKVGIRFGPWANYLSCQDSTPYALFAYLMEQLEFRKEKLAYVHFIEGRPHDNDKSLPTQDLTPFRAIWSGPLIAASGYKAESGAAAIASGHADLIAYGRWFLANPDLPKRFLLKAPLNKYDRNTFYTQGMDGYIDYPFLTQEEESAAKAQLK